MKRIKLLSDTVKKKISAGEVVEGPFSVVKELLENAIDSGANRIEVEVFESGLKKIVVRDNGEGIPGEDIELAVIEHATSKIVDVYDIERIDTCGFRGEALSSISSISRFTLLSRSVEEETGRRLDNHSGEVSVRDYAGPSGTTVIVENLFFNVPARKKFLKAMKTEMKYIRDMFLKTSLAWPEIGFSLEVDGKRQITLPPDSSAEQRAEGVYGRDFVENTSFESLQDLKVSISGFLSKPHYMKASRSSQVFFINRRPVEYPYLGFILSRAYEAVALHGKYPAAVIFIDIDPELIDVNIHPAKREVKLFDKKYIDTLIYNIAAKTLNRSHNIGDVIRSRENPPVEYTEVRSVAKEATPSMFNSPQPSSSPMYTDNKRQVVRDASVIYEELKSEPHSFSVIGMALDTYVIAEMDEELLFVDFHAAHERFLFDEIMNSDRGLDKQELIFPSVISLSPGDYRLVMDNLSSFADAGFDIEDFGDNTVTVRAVPIFVKTGSADGLIIEMIEDIKEEKESRNRREAFAATLACHSAKRAGDSLSLRDMNELIKTVLDGKHDLRCPHGRPYYYKLGKNELERIFKRQ